MLSPHGGPIGQEFLYSDITEGTYPSYPAVTGNSAGNWVIAWCSGVKIGTDYYYKVFAQRVDSSGQKVGPRIEVEGPPLGSRLSYADVAMADDGSFVVVWNDYDGGDGSGKGIFARRYDASGNPLGISSSLTQRQLAISRSPVLQWQEQGACYQLA